MSNHDYIVDNAVGATVRADINSALAAIATNNSSASEPATMYAYQWWADTTTGLLKQRNAANSAWITIGTLASANLGLALHNSVSLYPTVTSAAAPDIFAAAGATINLDNSTPVTTTSFAACTSAQVGSVKRVIPAQNWTVTASASLHVDGATTGNIVMPANAKLEVLATSTSTFEITTIFASGTWSPTMSGVTQVGATSNEFNFIKRGNEYSFYIVLKAATSTALTAGTGYIPGPEVPVSNKFSNCVAGNRNTALAIGTGTIDYTGNIYPPTVSVGANVTVIVTGAYRV